MVIPDRPLRAAATLVEILVAVAVLAVLAGLILSAVQKVRASAARAACQNNLRQLGIALHLAHDRHNGLPPGHRTFDARPRDLLASGWTLDVLPFIDQQPLWEVALSAYQTFWYPYAVPPHTPIHTVVKTFACPADPRAGEVQVVETFSAALTSYLGVSGVSGVDKAGTLFADSKVKLTDVRDGTSQTLLIGERPPSSDHRYGWWYVVNTNPSADNVFCLHLGAAVPKPWYYYAPADQIPPCATRSGASSYQSARVSDPCAMFHFWSVHPGGANFVFCDGSVRFLTYSAEPILPALATRAGGEVATLPD